MLKITVDLFIYAYMMTIGSAMCNIFWNFFFNIVVWVLFMHSLTVSDRIIILPS